MANELHGVPAYRHYHLRIPQLAESKVPGRRKALLVLCNHDDAHTGFCKSLRIVLRTTQHYNRAFVSAIRVLPCSPEHYDSSFGRTDNLSSLTSDD
jgi:hypothetical protein